ncbi:CDP-alcohol phosphatidyltransferase family protein [Corynebacterium sp. TAE3-ERU12]|nr:CDP-alcohol phosphatidyltransferase family protein [Corynebacterium sp. TAE3-ERU12]MBV7295513.1 CDP-alcohol phosphatidyltransferase family protein [Corynebacterium sp. TAE3-ERU12]
MGDIAEQQADVPSERVITLPNALSMLRIVLVPVYVWLLLGPGDYGAALAVMMLSAFTDWLDGKIARVFNMTSKLGHYLDPAADRLFIMVTPVVFVMIGILPWWVAALLIGRDVVLAPTMLVYRNRSRGEVLYLGKAATFALMFAIPCYLLAEAGWSFSPWFSPWADALMVWGTVLYLWTGLLYLGRAFIVAFRQRSVAAGEGGLSGAS